MIYSLLLSDPQISLPEHPSVSAVVVKIAGMHACHHWYYNMDRNQAHVYGIHGPIMEMYMEMYTKIKWQLIIKEIITLITIMLRNINKLSCKIHNSQLSHPKNEINIRN